MTDAMTYSDYRKQVQSILRDAGFYHGAIDGQLGPLSKQAFMDLANANDTVVAVDNPASPATAPATGPGTAKAIPDLMHNGMYTGILDLSHGNNLDLGTVLDAGFTAIIHKASEGLSFRDPKYTARKSASMSAGMLWGAYHFAAFGSGEQQARNFLSVEPCDDPRILPVLDFEKSSKGGESMTLAQAREFIQTVRAVTKRAVMIYGGGGLLREAMDGVSDDLMASCPLWLADYRPTPKSIPPTWPKWTLLQYTDGESGQEPRATPGSDGANRNAFRGTREELHHAWPFADYVAA